MHFKPSSKRTYWQESIVRDCFENTLQIEVVENRNSYFYSVRVKEKK